MAGTGKTTIAYSFCELLENIDNPDEPGRLAASFFCTRQEPSCRDVQRIVPSIAYQLSLISHPFRHALSYALETNQERWKGSAAEQMKILIVQPLRMVEKTLPSNLVITIDTLDECEDQNGVVDLLLTLLAHSSDLPFKFLLTSRPYPNITDQLNTDAIENMRLHDLDGPTVQADIRKYFTSELAHLALPPSDIEELVKQSGVLFIYAATVVRYVLQGRRAANVKRLGVILHKSSSFTRTSTEEIDQLYSTILETALMYGGSERWEAEIMISTLHTIICAQEPLTIDTVAGLLNLDDAEIVQAALEQMLSVLHLDPMGGQVTTLHESFPDFLRNPRRAGRFYCDPSVRHAWYARKFFDLIQSVDPPLNICGLESSFVPDQDVADIQDRIKAKIPRPLAYLSRYWDSHLQLAEFPNGITDQLSEFMSTRLLLWMEVMNLSGNMQDGALMAHRLHNWLHVSKFYATSDIKGEH